jgi:molybdate transport repressor ModE-like protein
MSYRPRLVHGPRIIGRGSVEREQWGANAPPSTATGAPPSTGARASERIGTDAPGDRHAMRDVQMENVHPLRLRLLLEIERTRSISAAAQACGIGQPSASMHVRNLETTIGQRLVARNGRGSSLTPAGKIVASHAARVLATLDSMRRAVDALEARGGGELTVAASLMPSIVLMPRILRQLSDRYPGVTVRLRTVSSETAAREVARGAVDLGIAGETPTAEPVARRQIALDELVGIARPGLLDSDGRSISLGELARNRLLLGPEGSSTRTVSERYLARADYRAANVWEFNSYETIKQAVKDHLGVSFISRHLVSQEIERKELVAFGVAGVEQMLRPIHLLQYSAKDLTPEGSAFMALLAMDASTPVAEWQPPESGSQWLPTAPDFGVGS